MKYTSLLVVALVLSFMAGSIAEAQIVRGAVGGAVVGGLVGGRHGARVGAAVGATAGAVERARYNDACYRERVAREQYYASPVYREAPHVDFYQAPPTVVFVQ